MNTLKLYWIGLLGVSLLAGCHDNKIPLEGKREEFIIVSEDIMPDPTLKAHIVPSAQPKKFDWTQSGGVSNHKTPAILFKKQYQRLWKTKVGQAHTGNNELFCPPIMSGGVIYTIDTEGMLSGVDAESGASLLSYNTKGELNRSADSYGGGIAIEENIVYITTSFGDILAFDPLKNQLLWRKELKIPIRSAPTVAQGRVFVVNVNNEVIALNAKDGELLWNYIGLYEPSFLFGGASPAYQDGIVVVPFSSGEICGFQVENGRVLWNTILTPGARIETVSSMAHVKSHPIIDGDTVFAMSFGGRLQAMDLRSGDIIWNRSIGGSYTPVISGDFLFFVTSNQELVCLNKKNGAVKWSQLLRKTIESCDPSVFWIGPLLLESSILLADSTGAFSTYDMQDGHLIDRSNVSSEPVSLSPIGGDGYIYMLNDYAELSRIGTPQFTVSQ